MNRIVCGIVGILVLQILLVSCGEGKVEIAQKQVVDFENYVDSLKAENTADVLKNWDRISRDFVKKASSVKETASLTGKDVQPQLDIKINEVQLKFEELKTTVETEIIKRAVLNDSLVTD